MTRIPPRPVTDWPVGLLERCGAIVSGEFRAEANVYCTLATAPKLFEAWLHWGAYVLRRSDLTPRDRELVILRSTALAGGNYPFTQHVRIGREVGLTIDEVKAVHHGAAGDDWPAADRLMLTAVDELMLHGTLGDDTWDGLVSSLGEPTRVLDLVATVAFYRLAAWVLNVAGTELDDGQELGLSSVTTTDVDGLVRPAEPRLHPLAPNDWPVDLLTETASWPRFSGRPEIRAAGVYGTLANHPALFRAIGPFMAHLLIENQLADRHREIVIVRSCLRDSGEYPYRQHVRIASEAGIADHDLAQLAELRPKLSSPSDDAVARAIDQLHDTNTIADDLFAELVSEHSPGWVCDLVATAGFYGLISFVLNATGAELEPGNVLLPAEIPRKPATIERRTPT